MYKGYVKAAVIFILVAVVETVRFNTRVSRVSAQRASTVFTFNAVYKCVIWRTVANCVFDWVFFNVVTRFCSIHILVICLIVNIYLKEK